ncbi:ABC transporter permease [Pseudogracilibacillus sp. SO30301A]|uniref:ABC transporter permease n=1 Tax=Pseudogracilibacillus sp. SO30301A TaxID=3098291 RepID=UPI00300DFB42
MIKLGWKLLVSRMKWFMLMCATISLLLASITSIFTASISIKMSLKEHAYQDYGEQTLVLLESDQSYASLKNKKDVEAIGQFKLLGTVDLHDGHTATVGTMNNDAQKLGKLETTEGNFPSIENGIAIEATYLSLIDENWKLGEKRKLIINGKSTDVTLTGIIKDYSAKWTVPIEVEKGINDFPNIIISESNSLTKSSNTRFLIKLKGSMKEKEQRAHTFIEENGQDGFINEQLFSLGLQNYEHITMVSFIFQISILITSFLCMYSIFYFFYNGQQKKFSLLAAMGANEKDLFKILLSQNVCIFFSSFIISIPFILLFHYVIINKTYQFSHYSFSDSAQTFIVVLIYMLIIFLITIWNAVHEIKRLKKYTINETLKGEQIRPYKELKFTDRLNNFTVKQIFSQTLTYPKQSLLIILTITFSILIIIFSIYVEKETIGLWDDKRYQYYLNSQEIYSFDTIDNLTVLTKPGLTFSAKDVEDLENKSGITFVQKTPFLVDLHPLLNEKFVSYSLENWINQQEEIPLTYDGKQIIPNVKYLLLNQNEFLKHFPEKDYKEFKDKTILYIPSTIDDSNEGLVNESITFVRRTHNANGNYETNKWEYKILDVYNEPFIIELDDTYQIVEEDNLIILLDEQTAMDNGIFQGFNELDIYLDEKITSEKTEEIEASIHKLNAITPGSLYQHIPLDFSNRSRISVFIGVLGKLSFVTSVILSILSITVVVYSKYHLKKKEWGIYLSMGMKKKDVYFLLYYEMILYFIIASLLALCVFSYTILLTHTEYSLMYYLQYISLTAIFIFFLISVAMTVIIALIRKQSIFSLLRENE